MKLDVNIIWWTEIITIDIEIRRKYNMMNWNNNNNNRYNNNNNSENFIQNGVTPLHLAAKNFNNKCLELLLSHGAEVNIEDNVRNKYETSLGISAIYNCLLDDILLTIFRGDVRHFMRLRRLIIKSVWVYYCLT